MIKGANLGLLVVSDYFSKIVSLLYQRTEFVGLSFVFDFGWTCFAILGFIKKFQKRSRNWISLITLSFLEILDMNIQYPMTDHQYLCYHIYNILKYVVELF